MEKTFAVQKKYMQNLELQNGKIVLVILGISLTNKQILAFTPPNEFMPFNNLMNETPHKKDEYEELI